MRRPGRLRRFLRRWTHSAYVLNPHELRMGSPQWGQLILDGDRIADDIEHESLTWSDDRRLLAAQHLVYAKEAPRTRIVVLDTERRIEIAATPPADGLSNPIRFEGNGLVYRHWHWRKGEHELRLPLPS